MDPVFCRRKEDGKRGISMGEKRYVVRMEDPEGPKYYVGSGYAGAGKPVPYFYTGLTRERTKLYKTVKGAQDAADRFGGRVGMAELDETGAPQWLGYVLELEPYDHRATYKDGKKVAEGDRTDARKPAEVDPFWDSFGQEKSDNVDAFDEAAGGSEIQLEKDGAAVGRLEVPADQKAAAPEGWRERQARIRREMAAYQKRKREQRKAAKG